MTFNVGDKIRRTGESSYYLRHGDTYVVAGYLKRDKPFVDGVRIDGVEGIYYDVTGFELVKSAKPHKWAKEIKAWADGAKIEYRFINNGGYQSKWTVVQTPEWWTKDGHEYRIYQEPKPDKVGYMRIEMSTLADKPHEVVSPVGPFGNNVKFTFDGETGKLRAVELVKE